MKRYTTRQRIMQLRQSPRTLKESVSDQNFKPITFSQTASHSSFANETELSNKSAGVTPTNFLKRNLNLQIPIGSVSPERLVGLASPVHKAIPKPYLTPTHKRLTPQSSNTDIVKLLKAKSLEVKQAKLDRNRLEEELTVQTKLNLKLQQENLQLKKAMKPNSPRGIKKSKSLESAMSTFRNKLEAFLSKRAL